jgi:hypothetical protein
MKRSVKSSSSLIDRTYRNSFFLKPDRFDPIIQNYMAFYLSLMAARPGNSLPSSNSRLAPPPVEM